MNSIWTKENYRYGLSFTSYLITKTDIYNAPRAAWISRNSEKQIALFLNIIFDPHLISHFGLQVHVNS